MITLHTFASGSEGNCLLLCAGGTNLLLDAGISCRRIGASLSELGLSPQELTAVLITHEHSDHIRGLETLCRRFSLPVYTSPATARQLSYRMAGVAPLLHTVTAGESFTLGGVAVSAFSLSHDAAGGLGYRFDCDGAAAGVLTDTGVVTQDALETLRGVALLVLESNHDVERLRAGPYPYALKARILSERGHLSNEAAADFAAEMARCGTRQIVLAHLSRENNTPELALAAMYAALEGCETEVAVAPRSAVSRAYVTEGVLCRR